MGGDRRGSLATPGYTVVFAKHHLVEPFELKGAEGDAWWNDCMLVARALRDVFQPEKMNYEIHGNTIPHLHLHLFPASKEMLSPGVRSPGESGLI